MQETFELRSVNQAVLGWQAEHSVDEALFLAGSDFRGQPLLDSSVMSVEPAAALRLENLVRAHSSERWPVLLAVLNLTDFRPAFTTCLLLIQSYHGCGLGPWQRSTFQRDLAEKIVFEGGLYADDWGAADSEIEFRNWKEFNLIPGPWSPSPLSLEAVLSSSCDPVRAKISPVENRRLHFWSDLQLKQLRPVLTPAFETPDVRRELGLHIQVEQE